MRNQLIDYFRGLRSRTFGVSDELPFTSGQILYLKNLKKIYVDRPQVQQEQIIAVIGNHGVFQETVSLAVYLATDAKNLPSDYETFVEQVRAGKNIDLDADYFRREVDLTTEYELDFLVSRFDFRFTKLI